jgi:hypothetical protein
MQPAERIAAVARLAELYKEHRGDMAELITAEIGAPISFAKRAQVRIPLMMFSAFCDLAGRYDWQEARPGLYGNDIRILKQPVGVVAAVVPWNMPQFLTVCKIIRRCWPGAVSCSSPLPNRCSTLSSSQTWCSKPIFHPESSMWFRVTALWGNVWSGTQGSTRFPSPALRQQAAKSRWHVPRD